MKNKKMKKVKKMKQSSLQLPRKGKPKAPLLANGLLRQVSL